MGRYSQHTLVALAVGLAASLAIHLPIYGALGILAKLWDDEKVAAPPAPVTVEFELGEPSAPSRESDEEPQRAQAAAEGGVEAPAPRVAVEEAEAPTPPERQPREQAPEPEERAEERAEVQVHPAPPPVERNLQAIQQRSQNPEAEAPESPRYIAEENSRVEEETVARLRNYQRDDVEQSPGEQSRAETEEPGNDARDEIADAREMEGSDQRTATEAEARAPRPRRAPDRPLPTVAARGDTGREGEARAGARASSEGERGGATATGGGEPERQRMVEVHDGAGTFRIAVPERRAEGSGGGNGGGLARAGSGQGSRGRDEAAGRPGSGARGEGGRGRGTGREGPDLRISWSQFEDVYTEEELRSEREAFVQERRSRLRGSNRERNWREFRAAIENFTPNVRPGNQTALNAAASPFAAYLAHVHRRIHRKFADEFLPGLPAGGTSPFADRTLNTKLEIILNRDGTVHRVGVVKTSGFLPFDHGAFAAVMGGQPYPEAPQQILSGDGKVYFHWGFYRNERQCGTFNAEPYILPNPPGTPRGGDGPLRDRGPSRGGVIPADAQPTWGTGGERGRRGDDVPAEEGGGEGEGEDEDDHRHRRREGPREGEPPRREPEAAPPDGVMG